MDRDEFKKRCCGKCRSLANQEARMLHRRCFFAWCHREGVSIPGEREAKLAPEDAYRSR